MEGLDDKRRYRRNKKYKIAKHFMKMIKMVYIYWYIRWSISLWLYIDTSSIWLMQNCYNEYYEFVIKMFCFRKHKFLVALQKLYFQEMQYFVEIIYPKTTIYKRKTQSPLLTIYVLWKNLLFKSLRVFLWFNFLWYYAAAYATNWD